MAFSTSVENVFNATDEVINRVFNHRPYITSEIRSMVKGFEEDLNNKNNNEMEQILDSYDRIKDINQSQIDYIRKCSDQIEPLDNHASKIEQMMNSVLESEQVKQNERKTIMNDFITKQNEDLIQFMEYMEQQYNQIDDSYERAKEGIYNKYNISKQQQQSNR